MASPYRSNNSTSSAPSAAEPADMADTSRPHSHSSQDKYIVSRNRTRVPSVRMPRPESRTIKTAGDLLAAEPGRTGPSPSHQAAPPKTHSVSRDVRPSSSTSRSAGDLSTSRTQRSEIPGASSNAGVRQILSNTDGGHEDANYRGRAATEISRTDQILAAPSMSLGSSESSTSGGLSRAVSSGSFATSRDFSGSSSSSNDHVTYAFRKYNEHAHNMNLSPLEEEEFKEDDTGNKIHCISFIVKIALLTSH